VRHPEEHPCPGVEELMRRGVDAEITGAIMGHAERTGTPRESAMAHALFAVDELAGFIVACAKVRPAGIGDLEARSVTKKLKDRAFAAAVSRDDSARGAAELAAATGEAPGAFVPGHIQRCIEAIRGVRERVGA
jgi:predicted hydrolase (HD superfamily)